METAPADPTTEFLSHILAPALGALAIGAEIDRGYTLGAVRTGGSIELTLAKGEGNFVVWLRRASDETAFYRKTVRFLIGYRGDPPDRQGFEVVAELQKRLEVNEQGLSPEAYERMFEAIA